MLRGRGNSGSAAIFIFFCPLSPSSSLSCCKSFLNAYFGRTIRRTKSSPGLCSRTSVTSSPTRIQFSSIPSGSMTSSSRPISAGRGRRTGCLFSFSAFLRSYVTISFAASFITASSWGRTSRPSKSSLRCEGS